MIIADLLAVSIQDGINILHTLNELAQFYIKRRNVKAYYRAEFYQDQLLKIKIPIR